jgi:hypothetical protein
MADSYFFEYISNCIPSVTQISPFKVYADRNASVRIEVMQFQCLTVSSDYIEDKLPQYIRIDCPDYPDDVSIFNPSKVRYLTEDVAEIHFLSPILRHVTGEVSIRLRVGEGEEQAEMTTELVYQQAPDGAPQVSDITPRTAMCTQQPSEEYVRINLAIANMRMIAAPFSDLIVSFNSRIMRGNESTVEVRSTMTETFVLFHLPPQDKSISGNLSVEVLSAQDPSLKASTWFECENAMRSIVMYMFPSSGDAGREHTITIMLDQFIGDSSTYAIATLGTVRNVTTVGIQDGGESGKTEVTLILECPQEQSGTSTVTLAESENCYKDEDCVK